MQNEMRDRLIELIEDTLQEWECDVSEKTISEIAEHLIENGVIVPPCNVGDVVYVITDCSRIMMYHDNDYLTGTGAIECPFENACKFKECNDENTQVIETCVSYLLCDDDGWMFGCEHINKCYNFCDIGKTVFLTREEAEQKLKGGVE